jgi:chitodextrinase
MRKLKFSLLVLGCMISSLYSYGQTTVSCNGYNPWIATQTYTNQTVFLNGMLYQSQWYNLNQSPATNVGSGLPWQLIGTCATPIVPASTSCANIAQWSSSTAYNGGAQVSWNGYLYTASFWTQGTQPDVNGNNSWQLVALCQSPASLSISGTLNNFTAYVGSFSTSQSFTLTGANLTGNVTITAPTHFEISTSQTTGYTSSLQLTPTSGALSTTIYVEYSPSTLGNDNGNIVISSTGVTTQNVAVTGTAQAIWLASGDYIYNANTGNVAIGSYTLPLTAKLTVNGTVKSTGLQLTPNAGYGKVLTSDSSGNGSWKTVDLSNSWKLAGNSNTDLTSFIGTTVAQPIIFKTNNVEAMRIASGGGITVGTYTTPPTCSLAVNGTVSIGDGYVPAGYQLSVNGTILATEIAVKLRTKWPDYVFAKGYKLMSLGEVEKYIKEHKHLPGFPASSDVESEGMKVGEVNTVMVEKIEELTLHAIQQQKLIDSLLKLVEEQNTRLEKLEKSK